MRFLAGLLQDSCNPAILSGEPGLEIRRREEQ
jgi:hypothetical protein